MQGTTGNASTREAAIHYVLDVDAIRDPSPEPHAPFHRLRSLRLFHPLRPLLPREGPPSPGVRRPDGIRLHPETGGLRLQSAGYAGPREDGELAGQPAAYAGRHAAGAELEPCHWHGRHTAASEFPGPL